MTAAHWGDVSVAGQKLSPISRVFGGAVFEERLAGILSGRCRAFLSARVSHGPINQRDRATGDMAD